MPRYILVLSILILTVVVMLGCDDRGTNITTLDLGNLDATAGIDPLRDHVFQPQLSLQLRNNIELLQGAAYLPAEVFPPSEPVPMLILLAPEFGDKLYYFRAGLDNLVKEMTASGEIDPMVVYCVGNPLSFGGFWYGQSAPAGKYDDILGDSIVDFLNNFIPAIIDDPSKRGIAGIGQGAYGAFRAALKNPGLYSSISVADGPLDFDGPGGGGGLTALFDDAIAEQMANYTDTAPFDLIRDWDTARAMPISMMFTGGALAFSPNDTTVFFRRTFPGGQLQVVVDSAYRIADSNLAGGGDSTTFIGTVNQNLSTPTKDFDFHIPFDGSGGAYAPIWNRWMENNLENIHAAQGGRPLDGVNIWVASNPGARWNYYEMTQSWISFLESQNYAVQEYEYSAYDGEPVVFDEYLYDLLRQMLKFHSDNFKN